MILISFFLQAEDGIRDYKVTGVQTCALPISCAKRRRHQRLPGRPRLKGMGRQVRRAAIERQRPPPAAEGRNAAITILQRSEERRVGKECRSMRRRYHCQYKEKQLKTRMNNAV